jgi:hypothetical protein
LTNGNYVVCSEHWSYFGFETDGGAVTLANGSSAGPRSVGTVGTANSLYGHANDRIGNGGALALENGNYVARSTPSFGGKGSSTWGDGTSGVVGFASTSNSLIGSATSDQIGSTIAAVGHGNYVVLSPYWGGASPYGAVTWGRGNAAMVGTLDASRSLVGSTTNDYLGIGGVRTYADGAYVVFSPSYDTASLNTAGAVTVGNGAFRLKGVIDAGNSVVGGSAGNGSTLAYDYTPATRQLVVGRPAENIVTLFKTEAIFVDSFDE